MLACDFLSLLLHPLLSRRDSNPDSPPLLLPSSTTNPPPFPSSACSPKSPIASLSLSLSGVVIYSSTGSITATAGHRKSRFLGLSRLLFSYILSTGAIPRLKRLNNATSLAQSGLVAHISCRNLTALSRICILPCPRRLPRADRFRCAGAAAVSRLRPLLTPKKNPHNVRARARRPHVDSLASASATAPFPPPPSNPSSAI